MLEETGEYEPNQPTLLNSSKSSFDIAVQHYMNDMTIEAEEDDKNDQIFFWGRIGHETFAKPTPKQLYLGNQNVKTVKCGGKGQFVILTENGKVWTFGQGERGDILFPVATFPLLCSPFCSFFWGRIFGTWQF